MKRMNELYKILSEAATNYYVYDNSTLLDSEYDELYDELKKLELLYPEFIKENSPTKRVGGFILEGFNKFEHSTPMLSLDNAMNEQDLINFDEGIKKVVSSYTYVIELKIDGLSVALHYNNGKLISAATRGNGNIGENVFENVKLIKSIPLEIAYLEPLEVRGEIYMSKSSFENLNKNQILKNEKTFANPRNAAAGSIRTLDTSVVASRNLDAFLFQVIDSNNDHFQDLEFLKSNNFKINPKIRHCSNIQEVLKFVEEAKLYKNDLDYEIDGLVVKVNEKRFYDEIGYTSKAPKFAIAYKFPAEIKETFLEDIIFSLGRTGQVTPNAVLKPVVLAQTNVSAATLHNEDFILEKDIRIGDYVYVRKAGEIIPEVVGVNFEKRNKQLPFIMTKNCPICDSVLEKNENITGSFCVNPKCDGQLSLNLVHYASRDCLNMMGFGEKIIQDLYSLNILKKIEDFYFLENHKDTIINRENYGQKSYDNFIDSVEKSKTLSAELLLFALGIKNVGKKTAEILLDEFSDLENLFASSYEDFVKIDGLGPIIATSLNNFIKENNHLIKFFKDNNINIKYSKEKNININFVLKKIVVTGSFEKYSRKEIENLLKSMGAKVSGSVSKNTDIVIYGNAAGSKLNKAQDLGIQTIDEENFLALLN